ncbi:uncharacterized protein POS17_2064 [Pseudomonas sp. Os17]|nr:uncharacterized protein POS17_2064 [Pseudomonas sp. Os17]BAQ80045.1 uncharacterized protein PST29_2156 [Pseudomonas sp. St29]
MLPGVWHCDLGIRQVLCDTGAFPALKEATVQIDLNQPDALTLEAVRQLLASASDSVHTQLRVTKGGIAYISSGVVGGAEIEGLLFRLETWAAGSGYVGNVAASDEVWVMQIFNALKQNWPKPAFDYIDIY